NLAEIAGPEHAGRQDAQAARRLLRLIAEGVNDPALDKDGLTRLGQEILAIDAPSRRAGQPLNRFVPALVIMGDRHTGVGLDRHLEGVETAGGLVLCLKEPKLD